MNLLIIGSSGRYAIEKPYLKYLSLDRSVKSVDLFPAKDMFLHYYEKNVVNKLLYRGGISAILRTINNRVVQTIEIKQPDVVFVFKGMEIFPETLRWMKSKKIKLVNYNPDNPFHFSGRGSGNSNITKAIGLYDLHFTYNYVIKSQLEREFEVPTLLLPFGFDLSTVLFDDCRTTPEVLKTCFVGNPDKFRASFIKALADANVEVDVYGHDWSRFVNHRNITIHDAVYEDGFWKTLRKYRLQLNLMRPHNPESHNMRSFEVPGVGGIMVAPDTAEHRSFFENEREVFLFSGFDDCLSQIRKLLCASDAEISAMRDAARERSLSSGYTYEDRSRQALSGIKSVLCVS